MDSPDSQAILHAALKLPAEDREQIADRLVESLDHSHLTDIDRAWVVEAERRLDDLLSGRVTGIEGEHAFDEIERELGWRD